MGFPYGWKRKCPLVIQASGIVLANGINSDLTDFPVLLTEDTLPLEMFDADGSYTAINGGGDIRFSFDSDGDTQLACEVVTFITDNDPNNGKAEIWVKVPTVSSGVNTTFYVWYNKTDGTQPVSSGTYGSENVWGSNFKGVWHLKEDPSGTAPQELDSTMNDNNGTSNGSMTSDDLVEGQVGRALDLDGSDDYIDCGNNVSLDITDVITIEIWVKKVDTDFKVVLSKSVGGDSHCTYNVGFLSDNKMFFSYNDGNNWIGYHSKCIIPTNKWTYVVWVIDTSTGNIIFYANGAFADIVGGLPSSLPSTQNVVTIGGSKYSSEHFNGIIDEVYIYNRALSASEIKAGYNNQNDPSAFIVAGTPESYYISGYVFEKNNPVSRKLYLHNRSTGELINVTMSSGNGYYYMETSFSGSHYIVCLDDDAGTEYNDLIIGRAFPTLVT